MDTGEILYHVTRQEHREKPLHYGRSGKNRYDSQDKKYGVLYLGCNFRTAVMESVFHEHNWSGDIDRQIALHEVVDKVLRVIKIVEPLLLADLTASDTMLQHGMDLAHLAARAESKDNPGFKYTQEFSAQVHALPEFDGVLYPSRKNYPGKAIALFERADHKIQPMENRNLVSVPDWPDFVERYDIAVVEI